MKANEFVKMYGCDFVKRDVAALECGYITKADFLEHYGFEILDDLKRLVESYELVRHYGGLHMAGADVMDLDGFEKTAPYWVKIKQAINDVESCQ